MTTSRALPHTPLLRALLAALLILIALSSSGGAVAAAKLPQKSVVISYPADVPGGVVQQAKQAIEAAGGMVTHEYKIFKGFAATAPVKAFETVKSLAAEWVPLIEEDLIVTIED